MFYLIIGTNVPIIHIYKTNAPIMINPKRLHDTFITLIQIDGASGNEMNVSRYIKKKFAELQIPLIEDSAGKSFGGNAGNLIGLYKGNLSNTPAILFSSHMDTIQPTVNLKYQIKDGIISSDKTTILGADNRAGVAAILEIITSIKEKRIPTGPIEIIFTVAEEIGMHGSKYLKRHNIQSHIGFVFDSSASPGNVIIEAPTSVHLKIKVIGKAAHAAVQPENGVNAIHIAGKAIADIKLGRISNKSTVNLGILKGGKAINIVPDEVELEGEVRSTDDGELNTQITLFNETFGQRAKEAGGFSEMETFQKYERFKLNENTHVVKIAKNGVINAGLKPNLISYPGGSDANIFNQIGIPTVNLGVGFRNVHSFQESIELESLYATSMVGLEIAKTALTYN